MATTPFFPQNTPPPSVPLLHLQPNPQLVAIRRVHPLPSTVRKPFLVYLNAFSHSYPTVYTFVVTLSLLFVIFGSLVIRSVRLRRQRNAALLAGIAAGTYVPTTGPRGKRDTILAPKPHLWEAYTVPVDDTEKGWAGIWPVGGSTFVLVTETPAYVKSQSPRASWWSQLRIPFFGSRRRSVRPDPRSTTLTTPSLEEPLAPTPVSSEPIQISVLISMPIPPTHGTPENQNRSDGPPLVELGVTQVKYAPRPATL
ncbi:hypothetical protein BGW80DRAFT_1257369 [Lactifluus volemus]|nr:hypothetical protein BGW80DRAFT_1257369 [Lactifluus volemus]